MNRIRLAGTVVDTPFFSHVTNGENFYKSRITCERKSGFLDIINIIIPQIMIGEFKEGAKVTINGEIRTRNVERRTELAVLVTQVENYDGYDDNYVRAELFICKEPVCRTTPFGREICDIMTASNRERSNKSDYIPCIGWGRNAKRLGAKKVGEQINIEGRLQSRDYIKTHEDGTSEERIAYEVSISRMEEVNKNEDN